MQPIVGNVAALAVALIFYTWRMFRNVQAQKRRLLCERVAYMLWMAADHKDEVNHVLPADAL